MLKEHRILKEDFKRLDSIYFDVFEEIFYDIFYRVKKHLLNILNSKALYFEVIMWDEAKDSQAIINHYNFLGIKKLNTKSYILHTTKLMRPYTNEYRMLKRILRNYI
jgi:hypothetical protein